MQPGGFRQCVPAVKSQKSVVGDLLELFFFLSSSSLDVCATDPKTQRSIWLTICKLHALECRGRQYNLVGEENCKDRTLSERSCDSCQLWEDCDGKRFFLTYKTRDCKFGSVSDKESG